MDKLLESLEMMSFTSDWSTILGLVAYVLQALALYTIAKRRGIKKPWLAWVPLVNVWILGSISDQYRFVTKREVKNRRKILLGLNIAQLVIIFVMFAVLVWLIIDLAYVSGDVLDGIFSGAEFDGQDFLIDPMVQNLKQVIGIVLLSIPLAGCAVTSAVYYWMSMYDVFRSCDPSNSVVFLVVSIVGGMFVEGIESVFLLVDQNKDLGMPPRKAETVPAVEPDQDEPWVQE